MKNYFKMTFIFAAFSLVVSSCKKGDADPTLSLRTRKARLVGEWRLVSGVVSFNAGNFSSKYELDGSNFTEYDTYTGGIPVVYTGKFLLSLTVKKDGTFNLSEAKGAGSMNASGTWKFNTGVGKAKSKEYVIFDITEVSSGHATDVQVFSQSSTSFSYRIKGLRNKELQLEAFEILNSESGTNQVTQNSVFKFIQ